MDNVVGVSRLVDLTIACSNGWIGLTIGCVVLVVIVLLFTPHGGMGVADCLFGWHTVRGSWVVVA